VVVQLMGMVLTGQELPVGAVGVRVGLVETGVAVKVGLLGLVGVALGSRALLGLRH
jgi:hypothetical protein